MADIRNRLVECFRLVFPDLPEAEIVTASQATLSAWDSVAGITLINVMEDEFQMEMDFDRLEELDSFPLILDYVQTRASAG